MDSADKSSFISKTYPKAITRSISKPITRSISKITKSSLTKKLYGYSLYKNKNSLKTENLNQTRNQHHDQEHNQNNQSLNAKMLTLKKLLEDQAFNVSEINQKFFLRQWQAYCNSLAAALKEKESNEIEFDSNKKFQRILFILLMLKKRRRLKHELLSDFECELLDEYEQELEAYLEPYSKSIQDIKKTHPELSQALCQAQIWTSKFTTKLQ